MPHSFLMVTLSIQRFNNIDNYYVSNKIPPNAHLLKSNKGKSMRTIVIAAVAAMVATSASAMDLGYGLTMNTDVVAEHKFDAGATTMIINPELGYMTGQAEWTVGTTLNIWDDTNSFTLDDEFDHAPTLDFGVVYPVMSNLEFEAGTTYDFEAEERGELSAKFTFSF